MMMRDVRGRLSMTLPRSGGSFFDAAGARRLKLQRIVSALSMVLFVVSAVSNYFDPLKERHPIFLVRSALAIAGIAVALAASFTRYETLRAHWFLFGGSAVFLLFHVPFFVVLQRGALPRLREELAVSPPSGAILIFWALGTAGSSHFLLQAGVKAALTAVYVPLLVKAVPDDASLQFDAGLQASVALVVALVLSSATAVVRRRDMLVRIATAPATGGRSRAPSNEMDVEAGRRSDEAATPGGSHRPLLAGSGRTTAWAPPEPVLVVAVDPPEDPIARRAGPSPPSPEPGARPRRRGEEEEGEEPAGRSLGSPPERSPSGVRPGRAGPAPPSPEPGARPRRKGEEEEGEEPAVLSLDVPPERSPSAVRPGRSFRWSTSVGMAFGSSADEEAFRQWSLASARRRTLPLAALFFAAFVVSSVLAWARYDRLASPAAARFLAVQLGAAGAIPAAFLLLAAPAATWPALLLRGSNLHAAVSACIVGIIAASAASACTLPGSATEATLGERGAWWAAVSLATSAPLALVALRVRFVFAAFAVAGGCLAFVPALVLTERGVVILGELVPSWSLALAACRESESERRDVWRYEHRAARLAAVLAGPTPRLPPLVRLSPGPADPAPVRAAA